MSLEKEIEKTKKKLRETPVNKSTETERARLKSKIARLKKERKQKQKESGASGQGYAVRKRGDATVCLVGPPSAGKSTLLNKLTNAKSEVANYDFTTLDVIPGMMSCKGASIQILDVPGLIGGAAEGRGKGKKVLSVLRNCDLLLILVDPDRIDSIDRITQELYDSGIRINEEPPDVKIEKKEKGGIQISKQGNVELDNETIQDVLKNHGFVNCKIIIGEDVDIDRLIDGILSNRVYLPAVISINKVDEVNEKEREKLRREKPDCLLISAEEGINLKTLKDKVWDKLGLMRVYMKEKGEEPDREEPLVVGEGSTVEEVMNTLDKDFKRSLNYSKIWGQSAKFSGQKVGKNHELEDEDVLELRF